MSTAIISASQQLTSTGTTGNPRRRRFGALVLGTAVAAIAMLSAPSAHPQVPVRLVVQQGQMPAGGNGASVTGMFNPATNGLDQLAVAVTLDSGAHGLFLNDSIGFLSTSVANTLVLGSPRSVGHSDTAGPFVYAVEADGDPALWTNTGALLTSGDTAPGGNGEVLESFFLPKMLPDGRIYFLSGISESVPDFFYMSDGTVAGTTIVLRTDDMVTGSMQALSSVGGLSAGPFFYDVSDAGEHYAIGVTFAPNNLEAVVVDGALHLLQTTPTGDGDDWLSFHEAAINASGDVMVSARTTGANDEVIAVDGNVVIRQGDTVGGVTLGAPAQAQAISVNDSRYAAHLWTHSGGSTLFYSCDVTQLSTTSEPLLSTGVMVAIEGGGNASVAAINGTFQSGPALDLADGVRVYARVELDDGSGPVPSIVQLEANCCGNGIVDNNEECDDGNNDDGDGCSAICANEAMGTGGGGSGAGGDGGAGGAGVGGSGGGLSGGRPAVTGGCDCNLAHQPLKGLPWQLVSLLGLGAVLAGRRRRAHR